MSIPVREANSNVGDTVRAPARRRRPAPARAGSRLINRLVAGRPPRSGSGGTPLARVVRQAWASHDRGASPDLPTCPGRGGCRPSCRFAYGIGWPLATGASSGSTSEPWPHPAATTRNCTAWPDRSARSRSRSTGSPAASMAPAWRAADSSDRAGSWRRPWRTGVPAAESSGGPPGVDEAHHGDRSPTRRGAAAGAPGLAGGPAGLPVTGAACGTCGTRGWGPRWCRTRAWTRSAAPPDRTGRCRARTGRSGRRR